MKHLVCHQCGMAARVSLIPVEPRRSDVPDVGQLPLCPHCVELDDAVWRRRYRPVERAGTA